MKNNLSDGNLRTVAHTEDGIPVTPQEFGYDMEEYANYAEENDDK